MLIAGGVNTAMLLVAALNMRGRGDTSIEGATTPSTRRGDDRGALSRSAAGVRLGRRRSWCYAAMIMQAAAEHLRWKVLSISFKAPML